MKRFSRIIVLSVVTLLLAGPAVRATTVQGGKVRIDTAGGVKVNDANVVTTDIMASNGVIHVIDRVILPN